MRRRREHGTVVYAGVRSTARKPASARMFGVDAANPAGDAARVDRGRCNVSAREYRKGRSSCFGGSLRTRTNRPIVETQKEIRAITEKLPFGKLNLTGFDARAPDEQIQRSQMGSAQSERVPRLRNVHVRVPDLPVLRHPRFRYRQRRSALSLLGQLYVFGFHADGGGDEPRRTQLQRFRQRFMHKLVYFPANNEGDLFLRRLRQMP